MKRPEKNQARQLSENELDWFNGGSQPDNLFEIEVAVKEDLENLLPEFAERIPSNLEIDLPLRPSEPNHQTERISALLRNILFYNYILNLTKVKSLEYKYARVDLTSIASSIFITHAIKGSELDTTPLLDRANLLSAHFLIEGRAQEALNLMKFARSLNTTLHIWQEPTLFHAADTELEKMTKRIRCIQIVIEQCSENKLPSKKRVRMQLYSHRSTVTHSKSGERLEKEDESTRSPFSKLIQNMSISKHLPSSNQGNSISKGSDEPMVPYFKDYTVFWSHFPKDQTTGNENRNNLEKTLGPIYEMMLIRFGMSEVRSDEDYRIFQASLAELGIHLSSGLQWR